MSAPANDQSAALGAGIAIVLVICFFDGLLVKALAWLFLMCVGMPIIWVLYISKTFQDTLQRVLITLGIAAVLSVVVLLF